MKPVYLFLLAVAAFSACNTKDDPNAIQKLSGVCKEKSDMYLSITQNGNTRISVHDNIGSARIIFLGGGDSMMRVFLDIDSANYQSRVMLNAVMPAGNTTGIYHADTSGLMFERNIQLTVGQNIYYSTDLQLIITSLGKYTKDNQYGIREYIEAAGSFSGNFTADSANSFIPVSGEFCVDFDGEKK